MGDYANEEDAPFFVSQLQFGVASKAGPVGSTHQRIVERVAVAAGGNIYPVARPVRLVDARVVFRCLDAADFDAIDATPANCTTTFRECDGSTSGSIVMGNMVPGNVDVTLLNGDVAVTELEYVLKGTALTFTVSY